MRRRDAYLRKLREEELEVLRQVLRWEWRELTRLSGGQDRSRKE
jgi:hypothetical protein